LSANDPENPVVNFTVQENQEVTGMELSERRQRILAAIVEQFIASGEPVGSKALCNLFELSISSATIRNEMAALAELGLIEQPHTSAGRVPSHLGYRYYVDHLMSCRALGVKQRHALEESMVAHSGDPEQILEQAGELLAEITNCAAVSTTPADESAMIRKVDLLPMGGRTIMLVLVTSNGVVRSRGCRLPEPVTPELIETFYAITEHTFLGRPVAEINLVLIKRLTPLLGDNARLMQQILIALSELAWDAAKEEILLEGQNNLLHHREFEENAFELLEFLGRGEPMSQLLANSSGPLRVIIGRETPFEELKNSSLIIARYTISGERGGALGIIGPTRIDYAKLIPNVEYLTKLVGRLLGEALGEDGSDTGPGAQ
jgi:heat-inducible transcriptional repressor